MTKATIRQATIRQPSKTGRMLLYVTAALFLLGKNHSTATAQRIDIDQGWLAERTPPYQLTGDNSSYILHTDVTTPGTAFLFRDDNISIDLNGRTITYGDLPFEGLQNPGFEQGEPGNPLEPLGWDLTLAPNTERRDYRSTLFFDDYSLRIHKPAGSELPPEVVHSSAVLLPAPGRYAVLAQVKGGPWNAINLSLTFNGIEEGCAPNPISNHSSVYRGTDMAIGIICETEITEPTEVRAKFTLDSLDERAVTAHVDEVHIRPIGFNAIAPYGWNKKMNEITNGTIRQGPSESVYSSALVKTYAAKIHKMKIITNGINSYNIMEQWSGNMSIYNNHLEAHGKLPLHRHYPFSMIDLTRTNGGNEIFDNTLLYGPHVGIYHGNATAGKINERRSRIYNNVIKTRITATNGFAISAGSNVEISKNTIQPLQGHGIGIGAGSSEVEIVDNLIEPRSWPCSEYSAYHYPNSAHGLRMKDYGNSAETKNILVARNRFIGRTNSQKSNCYTEVVGITDYLTGPNVSNVIIEDNQIDVQTDNYLHQHGIAMKVGPFKGEVRRNLLKGNHILLELSDSDAGLARKARLISNQLELAGTPSGFHVFRLGYSIPSENTLVDTHLGAGLSLRDIYVTRNYATPSDLTVAWLLNLSVKSAEGLSVPNAKVTATDQRGTIIINGITDQRGHLKLELPEFTYIRDSSNRFNEYSPYQIQVSHLSCENAQEQLEITASTELTIKLNNCTDIGARPSEPTHLRIN